MSGFLLDTDVISMLSPARPQAPAPFLEWLERMDGEGRIFLSVVTIHEIEKGVALLRHKGVAAKAASLEVWLTGLTAAYADKIISLDVSAAAIAGQAEAKAISAGHSSGMADAIIAGIANAHGLTIVTRNAKHFRPFGVSTVLPEEAPQQA